MHSCVKLFSTPWTVAHQASLPMRLFQQEYCCEFPFHPPGDLPWSRNGTRIPCGSCIGRQDLSYWDTWEGLGTIWGLPNRSPLKAIKSHIKSHLLQLLWLQKMAEGICFPAQFSPFHMYSCPHKIDTGLTYNCWLASNSFMQWVCSWELGLFNIYCGSFGCCVVVQSFSGVQLFVTPQTVASQGSQSFTVSWN